MAIVSAFALDFGAAFWLMMAAAVFDFFDGFAARLLKVSSGLGKQLDSLADMVTFGVVPGMLVFFMLKEITDSASYLPYVAFMIPVFSALRLAKFNIDERQNEGFLGLPTPANALFFASLAIFNEVDGDLQFHFLNNAYVLAAIVLAFCFLMISELPLMALKFKGFGWQGNQIKYIFLLACVLLISAFFIQAMPFIIFLYLAISIAQNIQSNKKTVKK